MVSKELLREVIIEERKEIEDIFGREQIIEREMKVKVKKFIGIPNILAILGIRRGGKSLLAWQIFEKEIFGYINFDDERLADLKASDLNKVLEVFYELYGKNLGCIILDEPQNIDKWELFANRLRRTKRVIVTGSNSKLLSGELATVLTGRYISFSLLPFSFREMLDFYKVNTSEITTTVRGEIFRYLREYLHYGGFPERFKFGMKMVSETYSTILIKDVLRRANIKKEIELKKVANFLIGNFSKEFTFKAMKNFIRVKHLSTISKWVNLLEDAYLIYVLERFSFKLKKPIIAPKKVYCIDPGLINVISFKFSENFGRLLENVVFLELLREKYLSAIPVEVYYYKDALQHEVDFVVKDSLRVKQLIQVTYASGRDEIEKRELRALVKASDLLKCKNLLCITWDYEGVEEFKSKRIKYIPLWKWLLYEKS